MDSITGFKETLLLFLVEATNFEFNKVIILYIQYALELCYTSIGNNVL